MNPTRFVTSKLTLIRSARGVRKQSGKSVLSQVREISSLRFGPGILTSAEYYGYRLYDDARYSSAQKREFVTWHPSRVYEEVNNPHWRAICEDKPIFYALLEGLGYPHPAVRALFHPGERTFGSVPTLRTPEAVADFLRDGMTYPFFAKPVSEIRGRGASAVTALDTRADRLRLARGEEMEVPEYVAKYVAPQTGGYLFQERVVPHPVLHKICGDSVSTIRMVVLLYPEGPRLFRATWRVPVGGSITDNFAIGGTGNIKASVNPRTGLVENAVRGSGIDESRKTPLGAPVERHPDSGEAIVGIELPDWDAAVSLCLTAAASFPGVRYQSWDVALSESGPTLLELNYNGTMTITQVAGSAGFNDAEFRAFFEKHAKK